MQQMKPTEDHTAHLSQDFSVQGIALKWSQTIPVCRLPLHPMLVPMMAPKGNWGQAVAEL